MRDRLLNDVEYDQQRSVWRLAGGATVPYTDGRRTEAYLAKALSATSDLSSISPELEKHILDSVTEYHLSHKRAQLLRGFSFDPGLRVLEVGCGCGAITRFLAETFDDVIGIEGGLARAAIARMRTKDLKNVRILNAPFQDCRFAQPFDVVFCIGVFEYARAFIRADDPYDHMLAHLSSLLGPDGMLILAIENQFGLKYFASSGEDHSGIMFEGIEGYHRKPHEARTFGYVELADRIQKRFPNADFYFPYPDYKLPSCIISENLLHRLDASELIGQFVSGGVSNGGRNYFDEGLTLVELARNRIIPSFANSFLVVAGKGEISIKPEWLAMLFSTDRRDPAFCTCTRVIERDNRIVVVKNLLSGNQSASAGKVSLHCFSQDWIEGKTLHLELMTRIRDSTCTLADICELTLPWYAALESVSREENGVQWLDGRYLDAIWRNTFKADKVSFIDMEWQWAEPIRLSHLVIRSYIDFLRDLRSRPTLSFPGNRLPLYTAIKYAGKQYGINLSVDDFVSFLSVEAELSYPGSRKGLKKLLRKCALAGSLILTPAVFRTAGNVVERIRWFTGKLRKQSSILVK